MTRSDHVESTERNEGHPLPERLSGEKIYLQILKEQAVTPTYLGWLNDPEITKFLEVRHTPQTMEGLCQWVAQFDQKQRYLFGIFEAESEEHIGTATLYDMNTIHRTAHYGYLIGNKEYWGGGVALEALTLLFDFASRNFDNSLRLANVSRCLIHSSCRMENISPST